MFLSFFSLKQVFTLLTFEKYAKKFLIKISFKVSSVYSDNLYCFLEDISFFYVPKTNQYSLKLAKPY